jgi:uncharacterized protein YndB with AHSA1/START domain
MKAHRPVKVTQFYNTSAEYIFDAWTNPSQVRKWLFKGESSEIINVSIDLKPGGQFSILEMNLLKGEHINHFGEYTEIVNAARLAFTLTVPKHFKGETHVTLDLLQTDDGCELTLTQTGVAPEVTEKSWEMMLGQLSLLVEQLHVE